MICVVGFGRFGALTARYLAQDGRVLVSSGSRGADAIEAVGAVKAGLEEVCRQPFVVLCVPISALRSTLARIAPLLAPGSVVIDVCSVKVHPIAWMQERLPAHAAILGTHPMFGPDSAADSLVNRKMVLCNVTTPGEVYDSIKTYLSDKGLEIIEATPEEHDRQIAVSLSLTHFIGRSLSAFGAREMEIDTEGYKRLMHILGVVTHDTWQLFEDMHTYNPYAKEKREAFIDAMNDIHERLG